MAEKAELEYQTCYQI